MSSFPTKRSRPDWLNGKRPRLGIPQEFSINTPRWFHPLLKELSPRPERAQEQENHEETKKREYGTNGNTRKRRIFSVCSILFRLFRTHSSGLSCYALKSYNTSSFPLRLGKLHCNRLPIERRTRVGRAAISHDNRFRRVDLAAGDGLVHVLRVSDKLHPLRGGGVELERARAVLDHNRHAF